MPLPRCGFTLGPNDSTMPCCALLPAYGAPSARTYAASMTPQPRPAEQRSIARAAAHGSALATSSPPSQGGATSSTMPLQSSSPAGPSALVTSTAPGLTFASQSLQSPLAALQPSASRSSSAVASQLAAGSLPAPDDGEKVSPPPG